MLSTLTQKETEVAQRAFIRGVSKPGYKDALRSAIRLQEECQEKLNQLEAVEEEKSKQLEELPSNSDATGGLMSYLRRISAEKEALKKEIQENNITIDDLTHQLDAVTKDEGGITKLLDDFKEDNIALQSRIEELEEEFIKQNRLTTASHAAEIADFRARLSKLLEEKSSVRNQLQRLGKELMESVDRERQVMVDKAVAGEQIRQLQQAVEDLEYEIDRQRVIIEDQTRPEEEREAAKREIEALQERLVELQTQIEGKERELGLTTKEKIKKLLVKYGVPLAFAVAISSVVGVILSALKATGAGVKKLGNGLTDLGKKMAAGLPGLLGSVLGLALRAGGELLKFVGNNIWILVVAIGVVLLKKMKG
ncbi:myosin-4-like [Actinia tenebrosa]|uniref:Myosin-4-like n=1 Tax=Actinia tenebrosa TaxID=6105 RepID=A0A6P8IMC4_ACTTE|nr:myosin-4-like [Actinia tenebrosa]